jgi:hypothetical protein
MGMKVSIYLASLYQFLFDELGQNKRIEFDKTENTLAFTIYLNGPLTCSTLQIHQSMVSSMFQQLFEDLVIPSNGILSTMYFDGYYHRGKAPVINIHE